MSEASWGSWSSATWTSSSVPCTGMYTLAILPVLLTPPFAVEVGRNPLAGGCRPSRAYRQLPTRPTGLVGMHSSTGAPEHGGREDEGVDSGLSKGTARLGSLGVAEEETESTCGLSSSCLWGCSGPFFLN
jgi:hypothetical protein